MWHLGTWFGAGLGSVSFTKLDFMILQVISNLNNSMILWILWKVSFFSQIH